MTTNGLEGKELLTELTIGERRGYPVYRANPTLVGRERGRNRYSSKVQSLDGTKAMLMDTATGEITGEGQVAFVQREEVDDERFVKLYMAGLQGVFKLSKAGQRMFEVLWMQVQANPNTDRIELSEYVVRDYGMNVSLRVINRGIKELLDKEFIFMTTSANMYYFNVEFMFNGNRLLTAKMYIRKGAAQQASLPFDESQVGQES